MHAVYLQWKHGELSDREFLNKVDITLRLHASQVSCAGIAFNDKNLVRIADELHDMRVAIAKMLQQKVGHHAKG